MKKIVLSLLIVFSVILLAGCGKVDYENSPHITCTKTEDNSSETTSTKYTLVYDNNEKITAFKADLDITYKQQMPKEAFTITEKAMKVIGLTPGLDLVTETKDNGLYFSFSGKVKMLKILMKQLNGDYDENNITGDTKQEALNEFTSEGYTCEDYK
jgi:hypothetical protein